MAAFGQIQRAVDDLVGNLVHEAQALEIHVTRRHAQHLGHLCDPRRVFQARETHDDRGGRGEDVAGETQAFANQDDGRFQSRRRRAVFVQATREFDDELDAGGHGGGNHGQGNGMGRRALWRLPGRTDTFSRRRRTPRSACVRATLRRLAGMLLLFQA